MNIKSLSPQNRPRERMLAHGPSNLSDAELLVSNDCQCSSEHFVKNAAHCMNAEQESSWMSWITGDSRSAQFHYLDLLELLTRSDEPQKARSLSPRF